MDIYLSYRDDDSSGFALSIKRELARVAPEVKLVSGPVGAGSKPVSIPRDATILILVSRRWLRPEPSAPLYFSDTADPMRRLIEGALKDGRPMVPVLFRVPLSDWSATCRQLPPSLVSLESLNGFEIREPSFSQDLHRLLAQLRSPRTSVSWTESESQTLIHLETEKGGPLKWWSGRDKALRVIVDGGEVGALSAWHGRLDTVVQPGRHTVQISQGRFFKSAPLVVDVPRGVMVALICGRNIFTGGLSLDRKS